MRLVLPLIALFSSVPGAQTTSDPIPNLTDLLNDVRSHQAKMEEIRENYTFHQIETTEELDDRGTVHKTTSEEREVFFVKGRRVARLVKKNGVPLSEPEEKKEQERIRKLVELHMKQAPPVRRAGIIGMILAVTTISHPRRLTLRGRPTLAFDFMGDPNAKGRNLEQNAVKKTSGTIWFDEADRRVAQVEVRFYDNFRIAGGLLANVQKGTSFVIEQAPVGDGLWMQTSMEQHVGARIAFKSYRENTRVRSFDFKKFEVGMQQQISLPSQQ